MKFFATALSIVLTLQTTLAQDYLWPTNASHLLSSTFGEYRVNHLHAGIDIKTNGRTGYPVYAVADGYLQTIRASYSGYGKVIYQKLDDGNIAVYAHLDDFSEPLRNLIRAEQERQQRYRAEVKPEPNEVRLAKGEIIGFTGDTGSLFPHLHFELRDSLEYPFNPLNTNLTVYDKTAPSIGAVAITPVSCNARVNGLPTTQTFPVRRQQDNRYVVSKPVRVEGQIGIELKAHDTVKGIPNVYPPYGIKLFIDDSLRFQVQYDKFSYEQTRYAEIDRNYQLDHDLGEVFNRLWALAPHKTMPMNVLPGADGIFDLEKGEHSVHILAYDKNQNTASVDFHIISAGTAPVLISAVQSHENGCRVSLTRPDGETLHKFKANWVTRQGDHKRPVNLIRVDSTDSLYDLTLADTPANNEYLKIEAESLAGYTILPLFARVDRAEDPAIFNLNYRYLHNPKTFLMHLTINTVPSDDPVFYLQTSFGLHKIELIRTSPTEYLTVPAPFALWQEAFTAEIRFGSQPQNINRIRINLNCIDPQKEKTVTSRDSIFTAIFPADAVYDTLLVWLNASKSEKVNGGQFFSFIYSLNPTNQPLHDSIRIIFNYPVYDQNIRQIGIYLREEEKWRFIGDRIDYDNNQISTATRRLGEFALIRDITPPVIRNIYPGNGGRFRASGLHVLKATVRDELSGIRSDLDIVTTLDGYPVIAEYHGPKHHIKHALTGRLTSGQHILKIIATDRAGNVTSATSIFTILPG